MSLTRVLRDEKLGTLCISMGDVMTHFEAMDPGPYDDNGSLAVLARNSLALPSEAEGDGCGGGGGGGDTADSEERAAAAARSTEREEGKWLEMEESPTGGAILVLGKYYRTRQLLCKCEL